jgi:hypothetical protein
MNEPWDSQTGLPESIKVSDELAKSEDDIRVVVPIISKKCNWDDTLARVATNLFGWIWRGK